MIRRGMDEARYTFDYLTSTYDSKAGKVEKFTF